MCFHVKKVLRFLKYIYLKQKAIIFDKFKKKFCLLALYDKAKLIEKYSFFALNKCIKKISYY